MNENIKNSIFTITWEVLKQKKPISLIPSEKNDTVELDISGPYSNILVHSQGILIKAKATHNNLSLGLVPLKSDRKYCKATLGHKHADKAAEIILKLN